MARFDDKQAEGLTRKQREWLKTDQQKLDDAVKAMLLHGARAHRNAHIPDGDRESPHSVNRR